MLKMRLQRIGRRNQPYYRIVITDATSGPKSGKFIDTVGSYDPKAGAVQINTERATHWVTQGVVPSGTVHNMLVDAGILTASKVNTLPKKTPIKKETTA
jgi:small subunit ribosomal protein S16